MLRTEQPPVVRSSSPESHAGLTDRKTDLGGLPSCSIEIRSLLKPTGVGMVDLFPRALSLGRVRVMLWGLFLCRVFKSVRVQGQKHDFLSSSIHI